MKIQCLQSVGKQMYPVSYIPFILSGTQAYVNTNSDLLDYQFIDLCFFSGNNVYFCGKGNHEGTQLRKRLVITTKEDARGILKEVHDDSSHQGNHRTQAKIAQQYYWLNITHDVIEWVS